jgi:hypothetical protein
MTGAPVNDQTAERRVFSVLGFALFAVLSIAYWLGLRDGAAFLILGWMFNAATTALWLMSLAHAQGFWERNGLDFSEDEMNEFGQEAMGTIFIACVPWLWTAWMCFLLLLTGIWYAWFRKAYPKK